MKLSIISFTENGILLSEKIAKLLCEAECAIYTKCRDYCKEGRTVRFVTRSVGEWAKEQLEERNALLFIGACGIAVRAIAPHITDKLHDSPVLVMDETGQYVIPLLSGHVGGANELAVSIAEKIGAKPVITTATDINNQFAIDLFAKKNKLTIVNKDGIAKVSSKVLAGKCITMSVEQGHLEKEIRLPKCIELVEYPPLQKVDVVITSENSEFQTAIFLKPKEYVIGIGCRKGKETEKIHDFIMNHLQKAGISLAQVFGMASIDVKKDESGLLDFSRKEKIPFITYTAEELWCVEGDFHKSEFVKEQVGVDNVCERAALKICEPEGKLIYEKHAEDGMTIAIARREWRVNFDEE
ncbi:MAG: cobalt-precorrin 5A hydrolase [Lachnospiraceae bacterium]|nr:cobalt-precorrin 5A hydrolase [Lachnospiraceae bacterium]